MAAEVVKSSRVSTSLLRPLTTMLNSVARPLTRSFSSTARSLGVTVKSLAPGDGKTFPKKGCVLPLKRRLSGHHH